MDKSPVTVTMTSNNNLNNIHSPSVTALKSGLSMLLQEGSIPTPTKKITKTFFISKSGDDYGDFAGSYGSNDSFSESFFEPAKKPVHLGESENTASDMSYFNSFEGGTDLKEKKIDPAPSLPSAQNPKFGIEDLLKILLEDIRRLETETSSEQMNEDLDKIHGLAQISSDIMLTALIVIPAEEDGSPMDDLPSFSTKTELLSLGVKDFSIVDKASFEPLIHARVEGSLSDLLPGRMQRASSKISTQDSNESTHCLASELERPSSATGADMIQVFRMDSDESLVRLGGKMIKSNSSDSLTPILKPGEVGGGSVNTSSANTPRRGSLRRSSSLGLSITYKFYGSNKWRVVKRSVHNPNPLSPTITPKLKVKTSDLIPIKQHSFEEISPITRERTNKLTPSNSQSSLERRKKDQKLSIFSHPQSEKIPSSQSLHDSGLFRRHSEKTYEEESARRHRNEEKYSRFFSFSGETGLVSLNPHTSNSLMAQFSPSNQSSNPSRSESPTDFDLYKPLPSVHSSKMNSPMHALSSPLKTALTATTITPFSTPNGSIIARKQFTPSDGNSSLKVLSPSSSKSNQVPGTGGNNIPTSTASIGGGTSNSILNMFRLF